MTATQPNQAVSVPLVPAALINAKRTLRDVCPGSGSARVSEAMACALGFRTHEALVFATKSGNGPFLSFDADAFVRRLGELRTGAELPDVTVVREAMSNAAAEGALTCDMNGQSAFPAEWPALCHGLHLICTGDKAFPAHVAEQAFLSEFAMSPRSLRVLRVGAWGMDLSDLRSPLEKERHGTAPLVTERIIHSVRQSVRGVELAMVYHPDLAVFDDVTGRVQARLAAYVAGKGIRTLAGMRADTAFGALLMLDRMGISRASLGLLGRIDVVSTLGSGRPDNAHAMLRERHDCTQVFLARCVGKLPKPPRPRASPFARPVHAAPDPTGVRVPFNIVLADMAEQVVLDREKQSEERMKHGVTTYHTMLMRSHRITDHDFFQHGQLHHGRRLDRASLPNNWQRYQLLEPMDMARRLRLGDDVGANQWYCLSLNYSSCLHSGIAVCPLS